MRGSTNPTQQFGALREVWPKHPDRFAKSAARKDRVRGSCFKRRKRPHRQNVLVYWESGELPLQESLAAYERGAELLAYCQSALKDAQQQVQVLEKGMLQPFAADDADDA